MRCRILCVLCLPLALPSLCCGDRYEPENPYDPDAAHLDFDGDGVPNGEDGDPTDRNCGLTDDDVENCGECGHRCADEYPHAVVKCSGGECSATGCSSGWSDVNGDLGSEGGDGCECENLHVNDSGYDECDSWNGRGGPYVLVPGATFWQGCRDDLNGSWGCSSEEKPQHEVHLTSYWIDVHEVTQAEYQAFGNDTGHRAPSCDWDPSGTPDHPVVCVSWDDLRAYCQWAGGDLPTEAQWEYAARGPMNDADDYAAFPWGSNEIDCDHAVIDEGGAGCGTGGAWPACSKQDGNSPFRLCDMAGNVWEWCLDWYSGSYYGDETWPRTDPAGPGSGSSRVLRGGSLHYYPQFARAAYRHLYAPTSRYDDFGGRCARPGQP